jgi:hypothetical protein
VNLHLVELVLCELARLVQNVVGHAQFAYVVKERRRFERLQFFVAHPHHRAQPTRVKLNAAYVLVRRLVLGVDSHRQRLQRRAMYLIHLVEVAALVLHLRLVRLKGVVDDDGDRQRQRDHKQRGDDGIRGQGVGGDADRHRAREVCDRDPRKCFPPHLEEFRRVDGFRKERGQPYVDNVMGHRHRDERKYQHFERVLLASEERSPF